MLESICTATLFALWLISIGLLAWLMAWLSSKLAWLSSKRHAVWWRLAIGLAPMVVGGWLTNALLLADWPINTFLTYWGWLVDEFWAKSTLETKLLIGIVGVGVPTMLYRAYCAGLQAYRKLWVSPIRWKTLEFGDWVVCQDGTVGTVLARRGIDERERSVLLESGTVELQVKWSTVVKGMSNSAGLSDSPTDRQEPGLKEGVGIFLAGIGTVISSSFSRSDPLSIVDS